MNRIRFSLLGIAALSLLVTAPADAASTVTLSATAVSSNEIDLSWSGVSRGTTVAILRSTSAGSGFVMIGSVNGNASGYADATLQASTTYYYQIQVSKKGTVVASSNIVSSTTFATAPIDTTAPTIPMGVTATSSSCQRVDLNWLASSDSSGIKSYNVFRNSVMILQVSGSSTAAVDTSVTGSTSYSYTVSAVDNAGNQSAQSSPAPITTAACTTQSSQLKTTLIASGTFGSNSSINPYGPVAELGTTELAMMYMNSSTDKFIYVNDTLGNQSAFKLADLTQDQTSNAHYVLTSNSELWVFSSNGLPAFGSLGAPAVARQYALSGAPLPTTATLISTTSFGDQYSGAASLIQLRSGALVAVWYRPNPNGTSDPTTNWVDVGIAYRSPTGTWNSVPSVRVEGLPNHWHRLVAVQHPADDSVWVFSKGDSYSRIWSMHLTEGLSGLNLDSVNGNFITQAQDGVNGPESELPFIAAIPDPATSSIVLAYQNSQYQIFSSSPFVKGAQVSLARISAGGAKTFLTFPTYVERISHLGLSSISGNLWLAYRPINTTDLTYHDVYASGNASGAWGTPLFLKTTTNSSTDVIEYCRQRACYGAAGTDGNAYLLEVTP